jgi:outer membrane protein assembly factor BamB
VAFATTALRAVDWPQYRGPNHDGISTETIRTNWTENAPREVWKRPLDPAWSSFAIAGDLAFTLGRRTTNGFEREFCIALNAQTGAELWATMLGDDEAVYHSGALLPDGPRPTPTVVGDRVYVLSSFLQLLCLNTADGQPVWTTNLRTTYGGQEIVWQNAASPLVEGDLVLMNGNGVNQCLIALHKDDGSLAWARHNDGLTHATPVAATIGGVRHIIFFTQTGLVSVAPATGDVLWRYPFPFSTSTGASPVVAGDIVYCSAAYGVGSGAVQIVKSNEQFVATEVWRRAGANMNHWATPVHHGGFLFGVYGQQGVGVSLRCIELATGTNQWSQPGVGLGAVLSVAGLVLVLEEAGDLVLIQPDSTNYTELTRIHAVSGACWNVPAISNGRLYVRSNIEGVCLDVAPAAPVNRPPNAPSNLAPPDGATNQLLTLTLQASAFSDPDGDSHDSSQWIIKRSSDNATVFDSGHDTNNKTSITVPGGVLSNSTTYSWSVSYADAAGAQGPASAPTSFTTQPLAPTKLFSTLSSSTGLFQLLIGSADGSPLGTNRAANIDVFASTDLTLGLSGWIKLNSPLTPTNGHLLLEDPQSATTAQRLFRVEERP